MKNLEIKFLFLSLLLLIGNAKADKPKPLMTYSASSSITAFIDADTQGNCSFIKDLIEDNAKFNMMRAGKLYSFTKKDMTEQMFRLKNVKQNCTTSYKLLETSSNYVLYKVEMKYPTFTRVNYITLNEGSEGWKVSNASSVFL